MNLKLVMLMTMAASLAVVSCSSNSTSEPPGAAGQKEPSVQAPSYATMPQGTAINVTLVDSIDTDVQKTGAEFRARLSQDIVVNGRTLFARGAGGKGILSKVVESGHLKTPAELNFSLTSLEDTGGRWVNVSTTMITEKKTSQTAKDVGMIGGGAIVGGIVGKIIDKDASTEIGAAAGAAAGTGLALATGKRDIVHSAGSAVVFTSNQSVRVALR
ncbi:MAG: hypothetical protein WAU88_06930 [Candidatus Zixiibacteriota bacterium]